MFVNVFFISLKVCVISSIMKKNFVFYFFKLTRFTLALIAAFTDKTPLRNRACSVLLYNVWPVLFVSVWTPLVPMVLLKIFQFQSNKNWEELLDITHMFFVGCYVLYIAIILQLTSVNYKNTMDILETKFRSIDAITVGEFYIVLTIWAGMTISYVFFIGGCIYYKENLVPLWVPFVDNEQEPSMEIFMAVWVYESIVGVYMFFVFTVYGPFIIVSTVCIRREISYLLKAVNVYYHKTGDLFDKGADADLNDHYRARKRMFLSMGSRLSSHSQMRRFVKKVVNHHLLIKR